MNKSFRSKVFAWAHYLLRETGKTFAVCLSKAWAIYRLRKAMKERVVTFAFEKADGSLRKAKGTLKDVEHLVKGTGVFTPKTVTYYDVEKESFRSFKINNFITAY